MTTCASDALLEGSGDGFSVQFRQIAFTFYFRPGDSATTRAGAPPHVGDRRVGVDSVMAGYELGVLETRTFSLTRQMAFERPPGQPGEPPPADGEPAGG